ncbi:hypothetical protein [Bacillus gobiensis]|uniref:hypothetical protein n=1 Tax=Bacillus gobiensis TaxID=1441095 RepID=UPI003D258BDF
MKIAIIFFLIIAVFPAIYRLWKAKKAFNWIKNDTDFFEKQKVNWEGETKLLVLLPCLNEQSIVNNTLNYFAELPGVSEGRVIIIPVTGEMESVLKAEKRYQIPSLTKNWWYRFNRTIFNSTNHGVFPLAEYKNINQLRLQSASLESFTESLLEYYDDLPTTWELIDEWVTAKKSQFPEITKQVMPIHDPSQFGTKSTKLNYAISSLKNSHTDIINSYNTYIGVYDFDARPSKEVFSWLNWKVEDYLQKGRDLPTVFQQVPYPLGTEIEKKHPLSVSYLFSLWHLERCFSLEAYSYYNRNKSKRKKYNLLYCMGSGMFIRSDELLEVGMFPEDSDDIALGYRLDWMNKIMEVIPYPNWVQGTPSLKLLFNQFKRIFIGVFAFRRELKWVKIHYTNLKIKNVFPRILLATFDPSFSLFQFISILISSVLITIEISWFIGIVNLLVLYIFYSVLFSFYIQLGCKLREYYYKPIRLNNLFLSVIAGAWISIFIRTVSIIRYIYSVFKGEDPRQVVAQKTDR